MGVCKRVGDLETALCLFEEAKTDGIKPNEFMYSSAIWTAAKLKDSQSAKFLFDKMILEKITPNAICFDGGKRI